MPIVKDVLIADQLVPEVLVVHTGDEIRWINQRQDEVQIDIPRLAEVPLTCRIGFSNWFGELRESADLVPNESASLCFAYPTGLNYIVRIPTGRREAKESHERFLAGSLRIEGRE
jgi:hypothetical protein